MERTTRIISLSIKEKIIKNSDKIRAFAKLEESRKSFSSPVDYEKERADAMDKTYGNID